MGQLFDLRVLGLLEVSIDGQAIRLGPVERALLIALHLGGGNVVTQQRLADLIWDDDATEARRATIRSHISGLRKHLRPASEQHDIRLVSERTGAGTGYRLHMPEDLVDATRFERLVAEGTSAGREGRHPEAARLLSAALRLWRGDPYADVASRSFALPAAMRLSMLHRSARTALAEARLETGMLEEALVELSSLVTTWPDDVRLLRLLVVGLCRSERNGDAANACRAAIDRALGQGLDTAPLQSLQYEVLRGGVNIAPR